MYARGDGGNGNACGFLHHGGGTCGHGSGLRIGGNNEGKTKATSKDERRRDQKSHGHPILGVFRGAIGYFTKMH
jgi:hypothetical protein